MSQDNRLFFSLDRQPIVRRLHRGNVTTIHGGLEIYLEGYGNRTMEPGHAPLAYLEVGDDGHPVLRIWADFDSEDPTHVISLGPARERPVT